MCGEHMFMTTGAICCTACVDLCTIVPQGATIPPVVLSTSTIDPVKLHSTHLICQSSCLGGARRLPTIRRLSLKSNKLIIIGFQGALVKTSNIACALDPIVQHGLWASHRGKIGRWLFHLMLRNASHGAHVCTKTLQHRGGLGHILSHIIAKHRCCTLIHDRCRATADNYQQDGNTNSQQILVRHLHLLKRRMKQYVYPLLYRFCNTGTISQWHKKTT